jgi:hypothetical protein
MTPTNPPEAAILEALANTLKGLRGFRDCMEAQRIEGPLPHGHDDAEGSCGDGVCFKSGATIDEDIAAVEAAEARIKELESLNDAGVALRRAQDVELGDALARVKVLEAEKEAMRGIITNWRQLGLELWAQFAAYDRPATKYSNMALSVLEDLEHCLESIGLIDAQGVPNWDGEVLDAAKKPAPQAKAEDEYCRDLSHTWCPPLCRKCGKKTPNVGCQFVVRMVDLGDGPEPVRCGKMACLDHDTPPPPSSAKAEEI